MKNLFLVLLLILVFIFSYIYGYGKGTKFYAFGKNLSTWSCHEKYIRSARRNKISKILNKNSSFVNLSNILSNNGFVAAKMIRSDKPKFDNQIKDATLQIQYVGNPDIYCFARILFQRKKSIFLIFLQEKPMIIVKIDRKMDIVGHY